MTKRFIFQRSFDREYTTFDDWIVYEAIPFSVDSSGSFNASIDRLIASLDESVELLGFGEALHGGEDILILRNRLFQRLVKKHGYSAIAIESSFPRARIVNEYVPVTVQRLMKLCRTPALATVSAGSKLIGN